MADIKASIVLIWAAVAGVSIGIGSTLTSPSGRAAVSQGAQRVAVANGVRRLREPRTGDRWGGCNDARAAGTAPIYRGEPGYRSDMDGDDDGVACEPVP